METWHLIIIAILGLLPILIGAKFRSMAQKDEKYFGIGSAMQIGACLSACFLIFGDIYKHPYAFYIALGVTLIIYIITFIYIYVKFLKK